MKNLLIFISPTKSFDNPRDDITNDANVSVKVQIENSLALGWKNEDIMLFTNFNFEYANIKSVVLDNVDFFNRKPSASKINVIIKLFDNGTIKDGEIYWFHDLDAFQICSLPEIEIDIETYDMALTDYGWSSRLSTGVIYFKKSAKDVFYKIKDIMYEQNIDEERALTFLTKTDPMINKRVKRINKSYNFVPRYIKRVYPNSIKPIKVLHFHPLGVISRDDPRRSLFVFNGQNELGIKFIPNQLMGLLKYHRVR